MIKLLSLFSSIAFFLKNQLQLTSKINPFQFSSYIYQLSNPNLNIYLTNYLKSYNNINLSYLFYYAFAGCTQLSQVSFPNCITIGNNAFANCIQLSQVSFPNCTTIDIGAFANCTQLSQVSFPNCTTINGYAFQNCSQLTSLYLPGSIVCQLLNTNAFDSTLIASTSMTGFIFVPASLLSNYKSANNWSIYSSKIFAIEENI